MKLKTKSNQVNGQYLGFEFKNGIAEIPKEDEAQAKAIAKQLNYEIVEDEKPKAAPKKAATTRSKAKKEDE